MKIVALQAENIKKLVAIEIKPDGNLVEITGRNGQGKTSVLDSIWWALAGTSNIQKAPIRKGEKTARIRLDLGEMIVTRTFQDTGETITSSIAVQNKDGAKFGSPQTLLDELLGQLSFDPLAFARMKPYEQFESLKKFVPGVDFHAIEDQNKLDYARRTDINRRAKEAKIQVDKIFIDKDAPSRPIDTAALVDKLEAAGRHNADIETRKVKRADHQNQIERRVDGLLVIQSKRDAAIKLVEELKMSEAQEQDTIQKMRDQLTKAPALPAPIDVTEIRESIKAAESVNQVVAERTKRDELKSAEAKLNAESLVITQRMEARTQAKMKAISEAKLPVESLGFGDGYITYKDVPFDQAADSEQLRVSIAIAMALNPKLKVIRVRDGSLLDEDAMKVLAEMADTKDYQIWVERVDSSGKVGFVLEDGYIKSKKEPSNV